MMAMTLAPKKQIYNHRTSKGIIARNRLTAYAFLLPNFLGFLVFTAIPVIFSFVLCFVQWDTSNPMKFVGLDNFIAMFKEETFYISLRNTAYYTFTVLPGTLVLALVLALVLNNTLKGARFFRSIFFFPYLSSLVAVAVAWNMLFQPEMGPINNILRSFGVMDPPGWTVSTAWAMPAIILVGIWKSMGYYMIIYLAGLQAIPRPLYEAATVDGATKWQQFRKITLPMLTPTTFFVTIMLVINSFKVFDQIAIMTDGGPGRATNVLVYYIYNQAFINFKMGYASSVAFVLFVIVLAITIIQFKFEEKWASFM
jgi:ABC-type sugar transport system permease subunit